MIDYIHANNDGRILGILMPKTFSQLCPDFKKWPQQWMGVTEDITFGEKIIDIFRPSTDILKIVEEAIKLKKTHNLPYVIWMQLNIVNDEAAKTARNAGFTVIMNRCMMIEHSKLFHETL